MKLFKHLFSALILAVFMFLFVASAVKNYYQVYTTKTESGVLSGNTITFEDAYCRISYDLWENGGDIGFSIFNKTDQDLCIHLDRSFLVINGIAYDYYQNREYTKSTSAGAIATNTYSSWNSKTVKASSTNSVGFATSYVEKPSVIIPSKTLKLFSEFAIVSTYFNSCDLNKYPVTTNDIKTVTYNQDNSPYIFYNLIAYSIEGDTNRIENRFFVSEITNLNDYGMYKTVNIEKCGKKTLSTTRVFKNPAPDKFYFKYQSKK